MCGRGEACLTEVGVAAAVCVAVKVVAATPREGVVRVKVVHVIAATLVYKTGQARQVRTMVNF